MAKVLAETLKTGDVILPPAREVQLWMRRSCQERNLPETALHLTVRNVREGRADKRGRWLVISCDQSPEWTKDQTTTFPFTFKARPETPWAKVA